MFLKVLHISILVNDFGVLVCISTEVVILAGVSEIIFNFCIILSSPILQVQELQCNFLLVSIIWFDHAYFNLWDCTVIPDFFMARWMMVRIPLVVNSCLLALWSLVLCVHIQVSLSVDLFFYSFPIDVVFVDLFKFLWYFVLTYSDPRAWDPPRSPT